MCKIEAGTWVAPMPPWWDGSGAGSGSISSITSASPLLTAACRGGTSAGVPKTEAMEAGHRFEDYFFDVITADWAPHIQRQHILRRPMEGLPALIAHADGYDATRGLVLELKFSRYHTADIAERYRWQLQWYYFLGAERVRLIHGSGTLPEDVRIAFRTVEKDPEAQAQLLRGLCRIKEMRPRIREVAEMVELKDDNDESQGN